MSLELLKISKKLNFKSGIFIKNNIYIESGGVILNSTGTNKYFKIFLEEKFENETVQLIKIINYLLKNKPNLIFDIGACYGEMSIYFSKNYPDSKIFSVEASSNNIEIFKNNLNVQNFSTSNIKIINKAIFNQKTRVKYTKGMTSENSIILEEIKYNQNQLTTYVNTTTLSEIHMEYAKNKIIDFIKIDIEGSEPFLIDDFKKLSNKIKLMSIEFSDKNSKDKYIDLLKELNTNFLIFQQHFPLSKPLNLNSAKSLFISKLNELGGLDFLFLNKNFKK
tara:strand:- start:2332 stop:3165 length:834 start_codon:yes stop_codon:yes gene_type:complete